jgi:tetratricopeptide (TPR) repeat protein
MQSDDSSEGNETNEEKRMSSCLASKWLRFACLLMTTLFAVSSTSWAQLSNQSAGPNLNAHDNEAQKRMELSNMDDFSDKDEVIAFQAFSKAEEPAKKIQLGNTFLQKYPKSLFVERVDSGMMNAYRARQDWKNAYLFADHALVLQPDDVDVLATVAWTIPHVYSPDDSDADQELKKAESYAKHALEVLPTTPKPAGVTGAQFLASKAKRSLQAHSALGLVYFRREDYENSAKELEQATKGNPTPDQTDLYVLGVDLQNLTRYGEAADAFQACSQIPGGLQDQCKEGADSAKGLADLSKSH